MDNGGQCVRTASLLMMQWWLVDSWGTQVTDFMELYGRKYTNLCLRIYSTSLTNSFTIVIVS